MFFVQSFWERGIYINRDGVYLMDIEQLIERGRQGDEAALGSLYGAYHRRMTAICQRIVGDRRVAEELAHDAIIILAEYRDRNLSPCPLVATRTELFSG